MGKVVKTVLVIAVAVAVIVFAPQIAAVLASVAGSLGVTVAAATISSALIGMGLTMALTAAASMFTKPPSMSQSLADRLNTSVVPTAARKIVFGTTAAGQDVRFFEGDLDFSKSKIDGYAQVIALASHRISAVKEFYVENDLVWSNGSLVAKQGGFSAANPFRYVLEGKPGNAISVGTGRYWNSASTFTGCAYYVPFWKLDPEVWESGIPQRLTTIVDGCPLYDPRRDSTRGGSGAHRINNQDTWAFRDGLVEIGRNPALALLTYLIGWRINGKLVWGMGIPAHRIDFDNFRTYANLCEERVAMQGGSTVQRYTVDGIFSTMDSHETIINGITATMGSCKMTDRGGVYCLVGGYDDTSGPKIEFTADDLVAPSNGASPYIWNPAPPSRERFNIVRGRFANPLELYQLTDWGDPIEQEPLADGIPRTLSLDLGAVSRAETCQRIAKQFLLREYLTPGMFSATFGPKAFAVEVASVITLSLPAEGWNNKLFRVIEQAESHDMFFQMTLREEDPAIYAWDREEKPLPASIRPQGHDASKTLTPANLTLTSDSYSGANGINVSEVHVAWTPELSGRVQGIQIRSRPQGTEGWSEQAALFDPKVGTFTFTSNAPGITVEVQARFRMTSAVYSPWVNASVATAAVAINYDDVKETPTGLGDINSSEGSKLGGIQAGATVGAKVGTNLIGSTNQTIGSDEVMNASAGYSATATYDFSNNTTQGFTASGATLSVANGILKMETTSLDPILSVPVNMPGRSASVIRIRMRPTSAAMTWQGQVYYGNQNHSDSEQYTLRLPTNPNTRNVWTVVEWDMSNLALGGTDYVDGTLNRLRFDLSTGPNETWEIDWIQVGQRMNATYGAPVGSSVGSIPVADVVSKMGSLDTLISTTIPGINTTINNNLATSRNELAAEKATLNTDISVAKADAKKANDDLAAEVTRARGTEGAITTTVTNLTTTVNGHTTTISENFTSLTNKDTALANRATNLETTVNSTTDGNSALKARIAAEETARANADSAVATRTTKLEVASRGAGNLLGNTEFTTTTGWAVPHNGAGLNPLETQTGDYWNPRGETVLRLFSTNTPPVGSYTQVISDAFAVVPASWIQFYAYTSSHRAKSWTTLFFYDLNGAEVAYAGEIYGARINAGGPDLNGWDITGVKAFKVPATAVSARFAWRVYDNGVSNPVAWFFHPYVGAAKEGQTEWNPYSPGSGKQTFVQTNARIGTEETARANADSALAARATTLESTVNSGTDGNAALKSRIATEETTRSTADSTLALRATTLESRAKRTEGFASGDLIRKGTFEDGNAGDWTSGASAFKPVDYSQPVPPSGQYVLLIRGVRDCFEGLEWIAGAWGGRKLRVSGYASGQFSPTNSAAGVMIRRADGSVTWIGVRAANRYTAGYNRFDQTISLPPETVAVRPWMQNDGDAASTPDMEVRLHSLSIRDVTVAEEAISKVTEEAGARATADSALASRSTTLESQMAGASASGLQTMVKNNRKNLADVGWWKKGAAIPWALNGGQRNEIVQFPHGSNFGGLAMPDGSSGDAWLCQADGSGQNAGGWNSGPIAPLDPDKTYRFSVPIAALDPVGARSSYWGTGNVCHLNTTTGADNPYFAYGSVTPGKWYLFTGFIFPRNSVDMTHDGAGIYDMVTGERVAGGWNYCFHPAGYQPIHRAYQFYATNGAYQAFGRPMVELVDGTETPFNAMLGAVRSANARITAEEGVRATADSALATRATNLESTVNSGTDGNSALKARIAAEETTRASAVSSVAGRTTVVEAQVSTEASNMLRNGIFNSPGWVGRGAGGIPPYWNGWSQDNGAFLGASPRDSRYGAPAPLQIDRNGINNGITQPIFNVAPGWYAFEVDITGEDGNWSGSGVHCNFNNGYAFNFGFATNADTAGRVGDIGTANRQFTWLFYNGANTGNANLYLMSGWSGFQGGTNFGFFRGVWHRVVMRAATAGEILAQKVNNDLNGPSGAIARIAAEETARANAVSAVASRTSTVETSLNGLGSRVSTAEGSITTLNGRSSSYWQAVAVAGNNRAQITVRSDSNGGAGVDIVGDVTFAGNLNVKSASSGVRTEYTNTGIKTYNANGVLVFQSGIY